jgi:hypothetical protein
MRSVRAVIGALSVVPLVLLALSASATSAEAATATVSGTAPWVNTGVDLHAGDVLTVTATGNWTDGSSVSGPDGASMLWGDNFLNLADLGQCSLCAFTKVGSWDALLGYIGDSPPQRGSYTSTSVRPEAEKIFVVGSQYSQTAPRVGRLWLIFNADAYSNYTVDNGGSVTATIAVTPPTPPGGAGSPTACAARLAVSPQSGPPGTSVTVKGCGWKAGDGVGLSWNFETFGTVDAHVPVASDGTFTATVLVPATAPAKATYVNALSDTGQSAQAPFTVVPGTPQGGSPQSGNATNTGGANYVALGDSFSAGEGLPSFASGTGDETHPGCHRSKDYAYPVLLGGRDGGPPDPKPLSGALSWLGEPVFRACTGSYTDDLGEWDHQWHEPPQRDYPGGLGPATKVVTITIGGNDIGFAPMFGACLKVNGFKVPFSGDCQTLIHGAFGHIEALAGIQLAGVTDSGCDGLHRWPCTPNPRPIHRLRDVLSDIAQRTHNNAQIFVGDYPHLFESDAATPCTVAGGNGRGGPIGVDPVGVNKFEAWLDASDVNRANEVAKALNDTIAKEVGEAGSNVHPVLASQSFEHHGLCDTQESWVRGLVLAPNLSYSFHPTVEGQCAYEEAFRKAITDVFPDKPRGGTPVLCQKVMILLLPTGALRGSHPTLHLDLSSKVNGSATITMSDQRGGTPRADAAATGRMARSYLRKTVKVHTGLNELRLRLSRTVPLARHSARLTVTLRSWRGRSVATARRSVKLMP